MFTQFTQSSLLCG
ncbi:hypothetical protein AYI69_g3420, partial [Smittium culicis]